MTPSFLSHFTPSLMTPEALEAIFVQREDLAKRLVELIRDSALTASRHHSLLIGPRGIGKTHLVALVHYRVLAMEDLRDRLLVAWLREEEWGVTSFLDLLLRIFRALPGKSGDVEERIEALYSLSPDAAERAGGGLLKEVAGGRTLLLLAENLDDMFNGLGDEGQKRLRAYLQENPFCSILATAQGLFGGVSLQTSPFYGFFRIHHLDGLEIEEATRLLTNIARFSGDADLASFVQTPTGRARIRAVHHLAGGNHRVYVIFSQFLTTQSLDDLVEPFLHTLDELTPYYQARMAWLSPQQRKIVEFLIERRGAIPVKEIAQRCFMTHQTATGQLKILREMGYVQAEAVGRESYYDLQEPLMRICVEAKKQRGGPIRLIVDFLRIWYTRKELEQRLGELPSKGDEVKLEKEYVFAALTEYDKIKTLEASLKHSNLNMLMEEWLQASDSKKEKCLNLVATEALNIVQQVGIKYRVDKADVDDMASDLFFKLLTLINQRSDIRNYGAFFYIMTRNNILDFLRQKRPISVSIAEPFVQMEAVVDFEDTIDIFKQLKKDECLARVDHYIRHYLVEAAGSFQRLKERMKEILDSLVQFGSEEILTAILIQGLAFLFHKDKDRERGLLRNWYEAAQNVLGNQAEFNLTLRLLCAVVRYRETHDRRILLRLPVEERRVLEELLEGGQAGK